MRIRTCVVLLVTIMLNVHCFGQKVYTKNGKNSFFSKSPVENITADNTGVLSVIDQATGDIQFSLLIKGFHFKKSLMEEHFNENYLESDKYPKAVFKGKITDAGKIKWTTDGSYTASVTGDLTLHGVTQHVTQSGTIEVRAGKVSSASTFTVKPADYKISIPAVVKDNIAEVIEVTVNCVYDQKM